jgi:hypothetical protein
MPQRTAFAADFLWPGCASNSYAEQGYGPDGFVGFRADPADEKRMDALLMPTLRA